MTRIETNDWMAAVSSIACHTAVRDSQASGHTWHNILANENGDALQHGDDRWNCDTVQYAHTGCCEETEPDTTDAVAWRGSGKACTSEDESSGEQRAAR
jgi:hypothetical protein